jgi:hypothetical protein
MPAMNHLIMLLQRNALGLAIIDVLLVRAALPVPAYPMLIVAGFAIEHWHAGARTRAGARRRPGRTYCIPGGRAVPLVLDSLS